MSKRAILIVLDSVGIGHAPDAADYGDEGSNTILSVSKSDKFSMDNLRDLGFFNIDDVEVLGCDLPKGAFARLIEKSKGKDTTTGHWEMAGVVSEKPFPTYPNGFPKDILDEFSRLTGRGVLCNLPYSGTQVIEDYGKEHIKSSLQVGQICAPASVEGQVTVIMINKMSQRIGKNQKFKNIERQHKIKLNAS